MVLHWQVDSVHMFSNLETTGTTGTVGNVCLDVKNSQVSLSLRYAVSSRLAAQRMDWLDDKPQVGAERRVVRYGDGKGKMYR